MVDFLDFHAFGYHWPAFNVADSAIVVGAALLVGDSLLGGREALPVAGRQK
ncbi:MAG: signal peptidase II [Geminicoccaceae bacterium]